MRRSRRRALSLGSWTARYGALRDEDTATLYDHLAARADSPEHLAETCRSLDLDGLLQNPFMTLSNGQTRRARIASALLQRPELLVLEEPLAGLDVRSRASVDAHLRRLHSSAAPHILVTVRAPDGVPEWATHIVDVRPDRTIAYQGPRSGWRPVASGPGRFAARTSETGAGKEVVRLDRISVTGRRPILVDVDWSIREGERWALKGSNGALLAKMALTMQARASRRRSASSPAITRPSAPVRSPADPCSQSYSSSLTLFGRPRSSYATSDLQSHIGHVSPEIASAFPRSTGMTARDVISTGFTGVYTCVSAAPRRLTPSYRRITPEQSQELDRLLLEFDYSSVLTSGLLRTPFGHLSPAHQALVLFLRAVVKKPALLILDEPFQAQSDGAIERCRTYIDQRLDSTQAVIVVSHYEDEIPSTVDRVLRLEAGRVVERV